ncbi:MAG TPA: exodeoxyribonuclease I [Leucothrix mucor]|nr:exodeoxyribonuclease I [Leucothrix mucor]
MTTNTIFWHDYETWGVDPRRDRAVQFAGIRTNLDLEVVGDPVMFYCKPTTDFLPHPDAVRVTGIAPQLADREGTNEAEFFGRINEIFSIPGTCGAGYNSIRFDDEVTRFGFYRNFIDPYAREWQNGNNRWDILDLVRMTHALRPEGINWPTREDEKTGETVTSFRLEHLTEANNIEQVGAHDALVDVKATIDIARLIKEKQPRLYDFYFNLRIKSNVAPLLNTHVDLTQRKTMLHVTGMFPANQGCISPIVPLMVHPVNKNEILCYDLRHDPSAMLEMNVDEIIDNLYRPRAKRDENHQHIAIKGIHINKSPALSPINTLTDELAERWGIDWQVIEVNKQKLLNDETLIRRLEEMCTRKRDSGDCDADSNLYGGFISNDDRKLCNRVLTSSPEKLANWTPDFKSTRLQTLYPRYRARNWPETLNEAEQLQWQNFCRARLFDGEYDCPLTAEQFQQRLDELALDDDLTEREHKALGELVAWVQGFM